jgi:hypothetical protein
MKTTNSIRVGELQLLRRSDGGVYLSRQDTTTRTIFAESLRVGSSAAICEALSEAFAEMAREIRNSDAAR